MSFNIVGSSISVPVISSSELPMAEEEVEGIDFLPLKYEMLVSPPFNIPVGHADISSSSGSVSTSPLSMSMKTVVDNLEITRKNSDIARKNSEVIVQFMKEFSRTESKSIDFNPLQGDLARIHLKKYLGWVHLQGNFSNVPTYIAHDENSIIIRPVCERFGNRFQMCTPENILLDTNNNRLIFVNWGSAIKITDRNQIYTYEGTITFASPNILEENFARVIKEYWNDKLKGPLWAEMVNAVMDKNYDLLTKCCYILQNDNTSVDRVVAGVLRAERKLATAIHVKNKALIL
ncbi:35878_t:CDS:2, partial [Gigaspora margarita]